MHLDVKRYGVALLAMAAAIAARGLLDPLLDDRVPLVTLYGAVALAVWYGGYGPALVAAVPGYFITDYLFMEPRGKLPLTAPEAVAALAYLASCALVILLGEGMRRARQHATATADELRASKQRLEREIEARAQSHRALLRSEGRFRALIGAASSIVCTMNEEGRFVAEQPAWQAYTGQSWADYRDFGWLNALHPDDREDVRRLWQSPAADTIKAQVRLWHAASGAYRHAQASAAAMRAADGGLVEWVGMWIDTEERARAERERAHALATLDRLIAAAPLGIAILDEQMRYLLVNQPLAAMNGLPAAEHVGCSVREVVPALYEQVEEIHRRVITSGEPVLGQEITGATAAAPHETRCWEESWFPVPGPDGHPAIGVIVQDITERKRAEQELRRIAEHLRLALNAADMVAWEWDLAANTVALSENAATVCGADGRTLMHATEEGARLVYVEDLADLRAAVHSAIERRGSFAHQFRFVRPSDGKVRWAEAHGSVLLDERRVPVRMSGVMVDIDERKRAEQALLEADRRKDEFLATLAHELRNPLNPIRSVVAILRARGPSDPELDWARDVIDRQVGQMARLLDDLLDVARITRDRLELRRETVSLAAVIQSAVETSRPLLDEQHHRFTVTLPAEPVYLDGDPTRLAQIFSNLLNNAAKYTDRGGEISLAAAVRERQVEVSIRDTGIGITAEHMPYLFDMFSQALPALERSRGGLGIGLSLVRGLVHMHGGTIEAHSPGHGKGSEFVVRLPLAQLARDEAPPVRAPAADSPRYRVLVVDDNTDSADSLARLLALMGHEARAAHDGVQATQLAAEFRPDLVLLDIGLPRMNGYEVARHIRQQPWGKAMTLAALTGWGQEDDKRRALDAGFDHHLTKPLDVAVLQRLIDGLHRLAA